MMSLQKLQPNECRLYDLQIYEQNEIRCIITYKKVDIQNCHDKWVVFSLTLLILMSSDNDEYFYFFHFTEYTPELSTYPLHLIWSDC